MDKYNKKNFKKIKNKINSQYKNIGRVYNPALRSNVSFNSNGWHHLCYDNNRSERSKAVQINKLRFFSNAVNIIKKSTTIQEYRRGKLSIDGKESVVEWFAFWSIISFIKLIRIKVIVRRIGGLNGQYHFWSVMPFWSLRQGERFIGSAGLEYE
ncbi:MAG: hypothetical protein WC545_02640 [Patescibacteria group bacterium]